MWLGAQVGTPVGTTSRGRWTMGYKARLGRGTGALAETAAWAGAVGMDSATKSFLGRGRARLQVLDLQQGPKRRCALWR